MKLVYIYVCCDKIFTWICVHAYCAIRPVLSDAGMDKLAINDIVLVPVGEP